MKKVMALVLVLMLAVAICVSCAKKEEAAAPVMVSYTVYNRSGVDIQKLTATDNVGKGQVAVESIANGDSGVIGLQVTPKDGVPNVTLSFEMADAQQYSTVMSVAESPVTLLPFTENGEITSLTAPQD